MIELLRRLLPPSAKKPLRPIRWFIESGWALHLAHVANTLTTSPRRVGNRADWDYQSIINTRTNLGAVPVVQQFGSAGDIVERFRFEDEKRGAQITGFEGFAFDDSVYAPYYEAWQRWSFVPLCRYLSNLAYELSPSPSLLDLGCGPAHIFHFLRAYGVKRYIGVDGSPYFVDLNPLLRDHRQHFRTVNLKEPIEFVIDAQPLRFDLVCSFEFLEHMSAESIDAVIANISRHMTDRSWFLGTASLKVLPVHTLVRDRQWWLDKFAQHGLVPDDRSQTICDRLSVLHPWNWEPSSTNIFALRLTAS